jgi:hypothetical protein
MELTMPAWQDKSTFRMEQQIPAEDDRRNGWN